MRISDRYIGKKVLLGTFYAVIVLSIVLVLGSLFKNVQDLLVEMKAPIGFVVRYSITLLPLSLMYTVPWGFLSAVLLVFGRLSTDHEITSFRVAGVSLARLSAPVFVIGITLSGLSVWLNGYVVPLSKASSAELFYQQASRDPDSLLKPGVVEGKLGSNKDQTQRLLIEGKEGDWVVGFNLYQIPERSINPGGRSFIHARKASLTIDEEKSQLRVKLVDAYLDGINPDGRFTMGIAQYAEPLLVDLKPRKNKKLEPRAMTNDEIARDLKENTGLTEKKRLDRSLELARRYSFSMACLAFAFIAVPLGLNARRKDSSWGFILSLLIGTGYFIVTLLAKEFKSDQQAALVLWAPNIACVLGGVLLFRRARFK